MSEMKDQSVTGVAGGLDLLSFEGEPQEVTKNDNPEFELMEYEKVYNSYNEELKHQINEFADRIDVTLWERIMNFGSDPLNYSFQDVEVVLKKERGSKTDQQIIGELKEISNKANGVFEELNILVQKQGKAKNFWVKLWNKDLRNFEDIVKAKAETCYDLAKELKRKYEIWIKSLREAFSDMDSSQLSDNKNSELLEHYIVSGRIAEKRIKAELELLKGECENFGGAQQYMLQYQKVQNGLNLLTEKLYVLEQARFAYQLSRAQIMLIQASNINYQIALTKQKDAGTLTAVMQTRNLVFNAKNNEAARGLKSMRQFNDQLMRTTSEEVVKTVKDSKQARKDGIFSVEPALETAQVVINCCHELVQVFDENHIEEQNNISRLQEAYNKLGQYIDQGVKNKAVLETDTTNNKVSPVTSGGMTF